MRNERFLWVSFLGFNQFFEGVEVFFECFFSRRGDEVPGVGFAAYERLLCLEVFFLLEGFEVARQVAVGEVEVFFEGIEVQSIVDG